MTTGEKIAHARKKNGLTQEELGNLVGLSKSAVSKMENDELQGGPNREVLIKLSKEMGDTSLLSAYCDNCPIRSEIFIKKFPSLNNIETNPMVIAAKVVQELEEGVTALKPLLARMMSKDFASCPEYQATLEETMIQIVGTSRSLEILKEQYMVQQIMTPEKLREIIRKQQDLCEAHGHHKPGKAA